MMRTSGSSLMPCSCSTLACTSRISCSRSVALGVALVEDEIGMLLRDHRAAATTAFEARGLDQPRGMIAGRILEDRAAAPFPEWLCFTSTLHQGCHRGPLVAAARLEIQLGGKKPLLRRIGRPADMPVADLEFLGCSRAPLPVPIDGGQGRDVPPGLVTICARVHGECSTEGARDAAEELAFRQCPVRAQTRNARAGHTGLTIDPGLRQALDAREGTGRGNHRAPDAALAHQQIAAESHPCHRRIAG